MTRHGESRRQRVTTEYVIYRSMVQRCTDRNCKGFHDYGGRGIFVAPEWMGAGGYERFLAHVGRRPSPKHSIDRIDNDRGYEPGNVRWATQSEQARNTRRNRLVHHAGRVQCLAAWAEEEGVSLQTIWSRVRRGKGDWAYADRGWRLQ